MHVIATTAGIVCSTIDDTSVVPLTAAPVTTLLLLLLVVVVPICSLVVTEGVFIPKTLLEM